MSQWNIAAQLKMSRTRSMLTLRSPALHAECALVSFGRKENNSWYRLRKKHCFWFALFLYQMWHLLLIIKKK